MEWTSESEDNNEFSWGSDEEGISCDPSSSRQTVASGHAANGIVSNGACEAGPSRPRLVTQYMAMGFAEELVVRAIKEHDVENEGAILETLLTYSVIEKSSPTREDFKIDPLDSPDASFSNDDFSDMDNFNDEFLEEDSPKKDTKLQALVGMGFTKDEASAAIRRCGLDASISELADSITAAQAAKEYDDRLDELGYQSESALSSSYDDEGRKGRAFDPRRGKKRRSSDYSYVDKKRRLQLKRDHDQSKFGESFDNKLYYGGDAPMVFPNPMVGFGAPNNTQHVSERKLPESALGIPYFYYENVALTPKGVWETISRFLYGIDPEFVDSKYFCAANRKRGYVHNLPIRNRFSLQPLPPRTINEALPGTKKWWPSWDPRKQLNCLQTCIASAKLTERIRKILSDSDDPPPKSVQEYVLKECRKWNLVWVGLNKVAPLEPDEIEMLLGFPRDHTRGGGISRTDRYKSLGNSFQVDTVAYHLSVLKDLFPNGMNVLSLFSGIGGAEVALHRLGIHVKNVVSVEISEINRNIVRGWWEETGQTGNLYDIDDVQKLTANKLEDMIHRFGGFDLVIGGSPCNNLAGSNRVSRDGLQGEHSSLFFDYFRILDEVKSIMGRNIRR